MAYQRNRLKRGMGGSRNGRGRTIRTEILKEQSKKLRRRQSKQICWQIE